MGTDAKTYSGRWGLSFPKIALAIMRTTLLTLLVLATIVFPISGFVSVGEVTVEPNQDFGIRAESSWAGLKTAKDKNELNLSDNPTAAVRSRILSLKDNCEIKDLGSGNITSDYKNKDSLIIFPLPRGSFQSTSPFGYRIDPIAGGQSKHTGQDYAAPAGTPIRALAKGVVTFSGRSWQGANRIDIKHVIDGKVVYSRYLHMLDGSLRVQQGQEVEAGKLIALVGSTGYSTGNHLHLEILPDNDKNAVDPVGWLNSHEYVYYGELCD